MNSGSLLSHSFLDLQPQLIRNRLTRIIIIYTRHLKSLVLFNFNCQHLPFGPVYILFECTPPPAVLLGRWHAVFRTFLADMLIINFIMRLILLRRFLISEPTTKSPPPPPQPSFLWVNLVMIFNLPNMFKAEIILILLYGVLTILEKNPGHENHI